MQYLFVVLAALAWPAVAAAQTPTPSVPTSVDILVLPAGSDPATAAPVGRRNTAISVTQGCNLGAPSTSVPDPLINPTVAMFSDPFTAGRWCQAAMPTGLPNGTGYIAVAQLIAPSCVVNGVTLTPCPSVRSAVGIPPFNIQAILSPPAAPTNLVVRP